MTERASARHRADLRPSTPLTGLTSTISAVVGDHAATLGRGGMVLAVSSGLVAGVGVPASAATRGAGDTAQTAAVPLLPESVSSPALPAGVDALASAPVSASRKARLTFERSAFTAVATSAAATTTTTTPASATRDVAKISRSLARAAYRAARPVTPEPLVSAETSTNASTGTQGADRTAAVAPAPDASASDVVSIAMRYLGIAYRYGGTTPRGFDCSGFTQYVFRQVGISLPRTAQQQLQATTRISRSQARAGDLVFYVNGGYSGHVGIYLGNGKMIDSPRTGSVISVRSIYSANVVFGRV